MTRLVVCVDDFGLKPEVNEAVAELVDAGVVTATACMSQGPAWRTGLALLKGARRARLDVGLHLTLTEPFDGADRGGHPHRPGPDDRPLALPLPRLIGLALLRRLNTQELRRAVCAQLDAFEDGFGAPPDFVDGHQHVHQLPQVREVLLAELTRRYAGALPWLRCTRAPVGRGAVDFKQRVIECLGASALARAARDSGFAMNGSLLGVYGFQGTAADFSRRLDRWLLQARDGDLLMVHPARPTSAAGVAQGLSPLADGIAAAREREFSVLRDSAPARFAQKGVQAVRGGGPSGILTA